MQTKKNHISPKLVLLMLIFALKGVVYAVYITPPTLGTAPDDMGHVSYIQYIAATKELPVLYKTPMEMTSIEAWRAYDTRNQVDYTALEVDETFRSETGVNWIAQHPPLYYLLMTPIYMVARLFTNRFVPLLLTLRIATIPLGLATLYFAYKCLKLLRCNKQVMWCVLLVLTFSPAIQFYFSNVSNDSLLILLCAAALYFLLKYFDEKRALDYYLFVACCGGIIITKYTGGLIVVGYVIWFVVHSLRVNGWRKTLQLLVKGGLLALAIVGPVLARNIVIYGELMPIYDDNTRLYDYTIRQFLFESTYLSEIVRHILGLLGWEYYVRLSEWLQYFAVTVLVLSAFLYTSRRIKREYHWLVFVLSVTALGVWMELLNQSLLVSLAVVSTALIFVVLLIPQSDELPEDRERNFFLVCCLAIVLIGYGISHYIIYLHRGVPGATHGRYFYIALLPALYVIFNSFQYISRKLLQWAPMVLCAILIVGECQTIRTLLLTW